MSSLGTVGRQKSVSDDRLKEKQGVECRAHVGLCVDLVWINMQYYPDLRALLNRFPSVLL